MSEHFVSDLATITNYLRFDTHIKWFIDHINRKETPLHSSVRELLEKPENDIYSIRDDYAQNVSWGIVLNEQASILASALRNKRVVEPFAGRGRLASKVRKFLERYKSNAGFYKAYDNGEWEYGASGESKDPLNTVNLFIKVTLKEARRVPYKRFDAVVMSWPPYESKDAVKVLKKMKPGSTLYYLGEDEGGCCANYEFFDYLYDNFKASKQDILVEDALNKVHLKWPGIHDSWLVMSKKE